MPPSAYSWLCQSWRRDSAAATRICLRSASLTFLQERLSAWNFWQMDSINRYLLSVSSPYLRISGKNWHWPDAALLRATCWQSGTSSQDIRQVRPYDSKLIGSNIARQSRYELAAMFQPNFHTRNDKTRYRGLLKHRMHAYSRCMWMNLRRMVIFQISTFQRSIFALFGPIREAFGSFKAISRKIFTSGADCYVSLRMTTLVRLDSKYVPF